MGEGDVNAAIRRGAAAEPRAAILVYLTPSVARGSRIASRPLSEFSTVNREKPRVELGDEWLWALQSGTVLSVSFRLW